MASSRLVLLLIVLFGLPIVPHAAGRFDQKEVDAAIKSFLSAQKSKQEDTRLPRQCDFRSQCRRIVGDCFVVGAAGSDILEQYANGLL